MSTALPSWFPERLDLTGNTVNAFLVGATLYVLDDSVRDAAVAAALFLALELARSTAEAAIGDYADNAALGVLVLVGTAVFYSLGGSWWLVVCFAVCGGWFLFDGVQHLRHGVARDEVGSPYRHDGSALTGLPKALLARLVEPFRL